MKTAVLPILDAMERAYNRALLLESEKGELYFEIDTRDLLKGDIEKRFSAYRIAAEANIMQIDEIRQRENLPALGFNWVKLGLHDVLYDPKTREIYTPNTGALGRLGELPAAPEAPASPLQQGEDRGILREERFNENHDPENGRFTSGGGSSGRKTKKTKYAPSPQRNRKGIQLKPKVYARLCGTLGTRYPGLQKGEIRKIRDGNFTYTVEADGDGGFATLEKKKI